jgi:peptide/nickel transport system substrate-binding protein
LKKWGIKLFAGLAIVGISAIPALAKDKTILFLSEDVPPSLNYDGPNASAPPTQMGIVNLMEPLVYYATKSVSDQGAVTLDVNKFEGRLAESWSFDASTNKWTFKLRKGVTGCNGATFDADDVIYTMQRAKSTSGKAPVGWFLSNVASLKGYTPAVFGSKPENLEAKKLKDGEVRKIDQYTVEFTQAGPNALFLPVLTIFALYIFDKELMEANATADDPWSHDYTNNKNVPSFGPYCLSKWEKDKQFVVKAHPGYYRGKADIDRVIMRKVPEGVQRLATLRSGAAQLVEHLTPKEFDALKRVKGVKVVSVPGNATAYVHMNWQQKPWDNIKLREAIAYALPYDQIIKNVYFGDGLKYNGVMPSFYPGYHQVGFERKTNVDKAKALLAEAGFPGGKGLEAFKNQMMLTYTTEKENILGPLATIIQTELKKLGIPVVLNPIPQTQFSDRELVKKDLEFALIDHSKPIGIEAGYAIQLLYVSRDKGGLSNYSLYSNEEVDDLWLNSAKTEGNVTKRNNAMAKIQEILMKEVVIAPIIENNLQWAMSDKLSGVGFHPEQALRWHDLKLAD